MPTRILSNAVEASYTGLYTFIISIISLSPHGTISESQLKHHLKRMNAENYVQLSALVYVKSAHAKKIQPRSKPGKLVPINLDVFN